MDECSSSCSGRVDWWPRTLTLQVLYAGLGVSNSDEGCPLAQRKCVGTGVKSCSIREHMACIGIKMLQETDIKRDVSSALRHQCMEHETDL